jgi:transcriptional antiterminator NusG
MEEKETQEQVVQEIDRSKGEWYVVQTLSGQENKVKSKIEKHLEQDGEGINVYEVLIPTEKIQEIKQGKKYTITKKLFPGYVYVRMDLYDKNSDVKKVDEKNWYFIKNTQGVIGFVGSADKPMPLSPREVESLLIQCAGEKEKIRPKVNFEVGEIVRIKDGAFENFEGNIEGIDLERGKLKILVSIFGRSTPVELEFWQVEKES